MTRQRVLIVDDSANRLRAQGKRLGELLTQGQETVSLGKASTRVLNTEFELCAVAFTHSLLDPETVNMTGSKPSPVTTDTYLHIEGPNPKCGFVKSLVADELRRRCYRDEDSGRTITPEDLRNCFEKFNDHQTICLTYPPEYIQSALEQDLAILMRRSVRRMKPYVHRDGTVTQREKLPRKMKKRLRNAWQQYRSRLC